MTNRLEVALALLLITAGAVSLALYRWVFVDPTRPSDWQDAAAWVIARAGPRDAVRIEPFWYESGLIPLQPVGDRVQRIRDPILEDLYAAEHVFVVAQSNRAARAREALPFVQPRFELAEFGSVTVTRLEVPPSRFIWELYDHVDKLRVSRVRGSDEELCTRWNAAKARWDCAKPSNWLYVGQAEREVGDDPRRCVWAHPLDGGRTLRIEAEVPASKTIRVRDSFDLRAARLGGADALMQVFINDELAVEDRVAGNDHDWQAHDIDVSHLPGPVRIRIEVDALGPIKNRFFCLNAWALR